MVAVATKPAALKPPVVKPPAGAGVGIESVPAPGLKPPDVKPEAAALGMAGAKPAGLNPPLVKPPAGAADASVFGVIVRCSWLKGADARMPASVAVMACAAPLAALASAFSARRASFLRTSSVIGEDGMT